MAFCSIKTATKFVNFPISVSLPSIPISSISTRTSLPPLKYHKALISFQTTNNNIDFSSFNKRTKSLSLSVKCNDDEKKNITEFSDSDEIGDECGCDSSKNFSPSLQISQGKSQMWGLFCNLIRNLGNSIVFIVRPTVEDGTTVGVTWKLDWSKTHITLGKSFRIISRHVYKGNLLIGNVETIMEPVRQLKGRSLMGRYMKTMSEMVENWWVSKQKSASIVLCFFFLAISLFFYQFSFR